MTPQEFDPTGPLPTGVTILEASAGTGKTYTIEALVVRYVAGGVSLPRLLVVTFTRAATAELRDRVRTRLVRVADHLDRVAQTGGAIASGDPVAAELADGPADAVRERLRRLRVGLGDFDAATISTIHGFCQHVLGSLGLTGDADRTATLIEDEREVVESVVDDLLVRRYHDGAGDGPVLARRDALKIADAVVANPDAAVVPAQATDPEAALRLRFARRVRLEVDRRKRSTGVLSFNDVLTRLADTLGGDDTDARAACRRLAQQYRVTLIDEFQDTDPTQWRIVRTAFGGGDRPLVLIGDPKQAIYSFRGADVYAYLDAARAASDPATLTTNWRSDGGLLAAYNVLFADARLGHDEIRYRDVTAPPPHREPRIAGAPSDVPLQLRVVRRDSGVALSGGGKQRSIQADAAREVIARDLAAHVVGLLSSGARLVDRTTGGGEQERPVAPSSLAVLVRRNADAALIQRSLRAVGVPAVINGVGSVFATEAARDWLGLLQALERPSSPARARVAALTTFLGWTADRVALAPDADWDGVHRQLHQWAGVLRDRSVASLWQTMSVQERLPARLLDCAGGERSLTDLGHIGELLHAAAGAEGLGVNALTAWLREQIAEAADDTLAEERARRLESDDDAVQVMTVHRSKGLEFPVVYCPYLWASGFFDGAVPVFHPLDTGTRTVDVGGTGHPDYDEHRERAEREQRDEDLRLLYVALTRARHQAVVWWAPGGGAWNSPLARMLFCRDGGGPVNTHGTPSLPSDDITVERLGQLAGAGNGTIAVDTVPPAPAADAWSGQRPAVSVLDACGFDRALDHGWRRNSYTGIVRDRPHEPVGSEPDQSVKDDEHVPGGAPWRRGAGGDGEGVGTGQAGGAGDVGARLEERLRSVSLPMGDVGGGVDFGTFVHAVLEEADFTARDLDAELRGRVDRQLTLRPLDVGDVDAFTVALRRAVQTPLGPLLDDVALRAVGRGDRLDELEFELPLVGGLAPEGQVSVADIAAVLARHLGPDDPLAAYPDRLADPARTAGPTAGAGSLRGYLTGSIDAVVRVHGAAGPRFAVVDYKTNWLGAPGEALSAWHYRPSALADAMMRSHYPLQALLYCVGLHRYLRWRMAGYDPDVHLAGVAYLFVRGMTGPDVPRVDGHPCGVFAWGPPPGLVPALSDLLHRGRPDPNPAVCRPEPVSPAESDTPRGGAGWGGAGRGGAGRGGAGRGGAGR